MVPEWLLIKFILILLLQTSPVPRRIQFQLDTDYVLDVRSSKIPSFLHVGRHLGASDNTSSLRRGSSSGGIMQGYASVASNSSELNVIGTSVETLILCYQLTWISAGHYQLLLDSAAHLSSCSSPCLFWWFLQLKTTESERSHRETWLTHQSFTSPWKLSDFDGPAVSDLFPCWHL